MPLVADEAYYYVWSLRPQLSYFDHPAMVSWLIYLSRHIIHFSPYLAVRFSFILLSTFTLIIWFCIFKLQKKDNVLFYLSLICLNPFLGPGSILATPDVPLVFFWSLSFLAYLNLFNDTLARNKFWWYIALGCSLGLGFCSKYHIVLFVISGLIDIIVNKKFKQLQLTGVAFTLISGFLTSLPVLIWNYQNQWSSFSYQLSHGFGKTYYDVSWTIAFICGQILLINPYIFAYHFKNRLKSTNVVFSLTQFLFFLSSSFKAIVEANWPITSHLHFTAAATQTMPQPLFKKSLIYWAVLYAIITIVLFSPAGSNLLRNQYSSKQIEKVAFLTKKYQPLYGSSYQIAALLTWKSQGLIPKLNGLSRHDYFDTLPESTPSEKHIYVLKHLDSIWPEKYNRYQKSFIESFEQLKIELYELNYE